MESGQRANAAQMAARSIKAKPKGRMGRPGMGSRPDSSGVSQFAPQPSQNGGATLFGGNVQGSGAFSFSAPGLSFPAPSFGTPSPDVSDNEGRFAGDDRAMKRQFGGPSTMQPVQQPGGFGQSQASPFGNPAAQPGGGRFGQGPSFGNSTAQPAGNPFSFGTSSGPSFSNPVPAPASNPFSFGSQQVPASPSVSFGSGPVENKPVNNPFQFGQQNSQPSSFSSPFTFGASAPQAQAPTPQVQSSAPIFNFGSPAPQNTQSQAPKSPFTFGSTSVQEKPAATPFTFGQSPAPPPSSGINFGSKPTTVPPMSNMFGNSTPQPAQTGNVFGSVAPQATPTQPTASGLFGNTSVASPAMNGLFGNREQSPAPASNNLFGGPANTSATSTEPPPTPISFGEQNPPAPKSLFAGLNKPVSTSNIFNSPAKPAAPANNLFGKANSEQKPPNNLCGALNKPVDESVKQNIANGSIAGGINGNGSSSTPAMNSLFKPTASTLLGQPAPSNNSNNSNNSKTNGAKAHFPSASTSTSLQQTPNIFSPMKPIDTPIAASQPPPSGMFPSLPAPSNSSQKAIEPESPKEDLPPMSPIPADHSSLVLGDDPLILTDEQIAKVLPEPLKNNPQAKGSWVTKYRIDHMNKYMSGMFVDMSTNTNPRATLVRYMKLRAQLLDENNDYQQQFDQSGSNHLLNNTPSKQPRSIGSAAASQTPNKRKLVEDEAQETENPSKRAKEQAQVPEPKSQFNGVGEVSKPLPAPSPFKPLGVSQIGNPSPSLAAPSPTKSKRKAESQITKETEEASPLRQSNTPRLNGSSVGSNTSTLFKNILDSPSPSKLGSPSKPISPVKKNGLESKDDTPRINPFGKLPVPGSPPKPAFSPSPSAPPSNAFTRKAPSTSSLFNTGATRVLSNTFTPKATPALPATFTPKFTSAPANPFSPKPAAVPTENGASTAKASTFKPPVFNSSPVDFLAQFGKKASEDKKDNEEKLLQKAIDEDYDSDDDLEEFKQNYREKRKVELKELEDLAKNTRNGFVLKAASGSAGSSTPEPSSKAAATIEPAPKQFFGQSITQGSGTSVFSSLNASRTSTPGLLGSSTGSVLDGHASAKPVSFGGNIFAHLSDADSGKGNDADDESAEEETDGDEENRDPNYQPGDENASGGGTPASETGAGIASAQKTNFFSNYGTPKASNTFAPAFSTPSGGLFGRVGTKPIPSEKEETGTATPRGGLWDRIGSKEPSAEKEQSGTTTPGGTLFDRITKDSNGDPVRHISTEEKENTQPSTSNVFKDVGSPFGDPFNKAPGLSVDKTWKPDSPIRFGGAADASSSAPTVSITAATPTKTSTSNIFSGSTSTPTSNLFGSKDPKPASTTSPFSNLFGNSSTAKGTATAKVGFGFGAPSATSSLFPSAAGSANTSRATSPGVTTDAESGVDGDPDAEVHEQINLTAGGPGEENEDVLHEVRAKALIYSTTPDEVGKSWITKGVGPLRVLQQKETKAVRILLRADPLGTVILNKALLSGVPYEQIQKTVKILAGGDDGKGLETWLLQVKSEEAAAELAKILEANKPSS